MSKLYFKVGSDWQEVVRLRNEITKLEAQIKSMDANKAPQAVAVLNTQMQQAKQQMQGMITEAAKAGAVMENDFKQKIFEASQGVNSFTEKIIAQKAVVKDVEADVKRLGEAYRSALKNNPLSANSKLSEYTSAKKVLDEEKAALFGLTQEQANARLSVKKLRDEYTLYQNDGKQVVETNNGIAISWKKALAVIGGTAAIKKFISDLVNVRGEFQKTQMSFETMLGSKEKADKLMAQMVETSAKTPFDLQGVANGAKQLLAYGTEAENVNDTLIRLGNIASGLSIPLGDMVYLYGTTQTQGRLFTQDVRQFMGRGVPLVKELAAMLGKTEEEINKMVTAGQIGFSQVEAVIKKMTDEGGKFYNFMQKQSETLSGQISNLGDAWDRMLNSIGEDTQGLTSKTISMTTSAVENYESVGKILVGLITTYGAYRTAVMLVTAAESKHTLVEIGLTNVRILARKAQLALNASMLTNPYVALVVAVGGLVTAMWAMSDSATVAARAQKEYNEIKDIASKKEQEHKQKIDELISSARDESLATLTRQKSLEALREEYPKIFEQYDLEKLKLDDILRIKRQINEEDSTRTANGKREDYTSLKQTVANQQRFLQLKDNPDQRKNMSDKDLSIWKMFAGKQSYVQVREDMQKNAEMLKLLQKDIIADNIASYRVELKSYSKEKLEAELKMAQSSASKRNGFNVGGMMVKGDNLNSIISSLNGALAEKKSPTTYQQDLADAKANWEKTKKGYEALLKDQKATSAEVKKAKDDLAVKEKTYKDMGGVVGSSLTKQENQAEKLRKETEKYKLLLDKNKRIQDRAEVNAHNEITQSIIDAMENGSAKTLAQRDLNHKKEIEAIHREAEDRKQQLIDAARSEFEANPANKKKSFSISDFLNDKSVQDQLKRIDEQAANRLESKNTKYGRGDGMVGLLDEYKDYTDKRLTIEKKFNDDIAVLLEQRKQAEANGNKDQVDRINRSIAQATKDKGKSLMGLDYDKLKQSPEYVRAFENLKQTSTETLDSLLSQFEKAKQTAAQVLSPDQLREYTTTIQSIMDELDERNPFQALADRQKELADAENELAEAKRQLDLVNGGGKIVTGVKNSKLENGKISFENTYLSSADALKKYNEAKDKAAKASNRYQKAEKEVADVVDKLFTSIKDVGSTIGGTSGEVLSFIGDIGLFVTSSINAWETAASAGSKAVQAVEKASVILAVISTVIQLMEKLSSLSKSAYEQYEAFAEKVNEINLLTDAVNEYRIAALEAQQVENNWFSKDNLQNLRDYRKLHEEVAKAYKDKAEEDQATYQNQKGGGWLTGGLNGIMNWLSPLGWSGVWQKWTGQNYDEGISKAVDNLRIETRKKSKGFLGTGIGSKSQKTEDLASWIKKQKGWEDEDLFDEDKLINAGLAKEVIEKFGDKLVGQTKETLEALIDLREQYDEYLDQLHEYVSSLYEPLVDNVVDSLWDWLDTGKDALDSFKDYASDTFRDIVSDMMRSIVLSKVVDGFDKQVSDLYEKYAKGDIDEQELMKQVAEKTGELMDRYEQNMPTLQDILGTVNGYFKDAGIDLKDDSSYSQSSSKGGFQAMSQDTGEELNGRFTALQMAGEEIKVQNVSQSESLNILTVKADAILSVNTETRNIADEIRTIQVNSYLELQEIRENTGNSAKYLKDIKADMAEVKKNTSGLNSR